jgi:hypothetical protein
MTRPLLLVVLVAAVSAAPQQPSIQNARLESRQSSNLDRDVAAAAASAGDPVWIGWRVPIADGQRGGCCYYSDDAVAPNGVRGCFVENTTMGGVREVPQTAGAASGALPLEAGTGLVILGRLVDTHLERLRTLGDDCPLDAGGRTVVWLQGVTAADSVKFLDGIMQGGTLVSPGLGQRLGDSALQAIALHKDASADAILDRLATGASDTSQRRQARSLLGSARGAHGFATLRQLLDTERLPDIRRQLVSALGASRQPGTADLMLTLARRDSDPKVRGEAAYWLPQRGGTRVLADVKAIIDTDASDAVRQRAVQGLARIPGDDTTTTLIQLASASPNQAVKKEAVTALGRSKDPRAVAYLEQLLK